MERQLKSQFCVQSVNLKLIDVIYQSILIFADQK